MKIENDDLWKEIKSGNLRGLSIEGYFIDKLEKMNKTFTDEEIKTAYKELQAEGKINKIELGLIDDIKKDLVEAAEKPMAKAMDLLGQSIKQVKQAETKTKAVGKSIEKAEKQAKELGINIPELKEYSALYKKNLNFFKQTIAEINKAKIY